MFQNSLTPFFITTSDNIILEANKAACKLFGYTENELRKIGCEGILDSNNTHYKEKYQERKTTGVTKGDFVGIHKDGTRLPIEVLSTVYIAEDGEERMFTVINDIFGRKKIEKEAYILKHNTREPFVIIDRDLHITVFNDQFLKQTYEHFGLEVVEGMSIMDLARPERKELVVELYKHVLKGNKSDYKVDFQSKDGKTTQFYTTHNPIFDDAGQVTEIFITVLDITDLLELEEKQSQQEADLTALIENTPDLICSIDLDFKLTTYNSAFTKTMRLYNKVNVKRGTNFLDFFSQKEKYLDILEIVKKGKRYIFEEIFIRKDKKDHFEIAVNPIISESKTLIGYSIFAKEITKQKALIAKEEEQRSEFKALVDNIPEDVYSIDMNFNLVTLNKSIIETISKLTGIKPKKGMNLLSHFSFGYEKELKEKFAKAYNGERDSFIYEIKVSDDFIYYEVSLNPILNDKKIQTGISILSKNSTNKIKAEKAAKKDFQTLSNIMSLSVDVICTFDENGKVITINAASQRVWGYKPHELIGKVYMEMVYEEDHQKTIDIAKRILNGEKIIHFENRCKHKDGRIIDVLWSVNWEKSDGILYCNAKDITEKKKTETLLNDSLNRYKYLFENNPAPMFIWDFETLQIIDCNLEALLKYGYNRKEFLQLTIKDIRPAEDIPILLAVTKNEDTYGEINRKTWRHKKKNGEIILVETVAHLLNLDGRKVSLVQVNDITEKENALRELKDNEAKLRTATKIAKLGYWQFEPKSRELYLSDEIYAILEDSYTLVYDAFFNAIHTDDKEQYAQVLEAALKGESEIDIEVRVVLKNNRTLWIKNIGKFVKDASDSVILLEGTFQDITEQKKSQISLQERNYFIETTIQNLPIGIAVTKINDGKPTLVNKMFQEIYGWKTYTDLNGFFDSLHPDEKYRAETVRRVQKDLASKDISRMAWDGLEIYTPQGIKKIVNIKNIPIYSQNLMISSTLDVTETKLAEDNLYKSNERYIYATKATSDAIWDWDLVNGTLFWGEGLKTLFGFENYAISTLRDTWTAYLHPDDVDRVMTGILAVIDSNNNNWTDEYRFEKANGDYAYVVDKGFVLRDKEGKGLRMVGAMQDISKQKEREQQLKLFESVVLNTKDAVLITEAEPFNEPGPRILYVNEAFTKMTGYTSEEVIGKTPRLLQGKKSNTEELRRLGESLRKWEPCEITILNYKKTGEEFWVTFSVTPVADEKGWYTHWISIERDITEQVNQEQKLLEANRKIVNTLESIQDGFYALDTNWVITYWNKEAELLLKTKREEIIGKNIWEIYSDLFPAKFHTEYHRAINENIPVRFEEYLSILDCWFEMSIFPSEDGLTVYFKDITERKQVEQKIKSERNLLRTLIDNIPDTIYYKDRDGRKLISNKVDYQLVGASTEEEVLGKTDLEIFPEPIAVIGYNHDIEILKTGIPLINYEEYFSTKNGTPLWLLTTKLAIRNDIGKIIGLLGIGRDISERKMVDEKLKDLNKELEKHVQQLLVSNAELEQFAYIASHDLQEPLRMVTSFLTQIERKYSNIIDEKGKKYIYFAVDGAKRMRQIILDLLEFSRIGKAEDKVETVDLNELMNETLTLYSQKIKEKNAAISFQHLPAIKASRSSMRQVFQNLVSNCLKYSNNTGLTPEIKITAVTVGQDWQFAVSDNGIGIDPTYFDKIFIIFQRLHNKDEYSGTGIGLAVTKKIIENLGGKIWVESEEGKGSTFYFTINKQEILE
jgi:PAS domain S-box-containing protein